MGTGTHGRPSCHASSASVSVPEPLAQDPVCLAEVFLPWGRPLPLGGRCALPGGMDHLALPKLP